MVKTLFSENLTHSQDVAFRLEYLSHKNSPTNQRELWKRCKTFSIDTAKGTPASQPRVASQPQATVQPPAAVETATISGAPFHID